LNPWQKLNPEGKLNPEEIEYREIESRGKLIQEGGKLNPEGN
jgi:hypothetical protein